MVAPFSHFSAGTVLQEDEHSIRYQLAISEGSGTAAVYPVMTGIEIVELDFQGAKFLPTLHQQQNNIWEINHCLTGRSECQMGDGCLQYIGENDLFLSTLHNHSDSIDLPLGYYRGLVVMVDPDKASPEIERTFSGIPFCMQATMHRFFAEDACFLIQAKEEIKHIFHGMYTVPQEGRSVYYRLKVLELFLYLHYFDPKKEPQQPVYVRQQIDSIKQIHKQITRKPGCHFPIEELARQYCMSATTLKSAFKAVYGTSIYAYVKNYRIEQAADLLRRTQKSVAEIALEMGYSSQSKFGAAFKKQMKATPTEYRKTFQ